jgi:hypothetical protein
VSDRAAQALAGVIDDRSSGRARELHGKTVRGIVVKPKPLTIKTGRFTLTKDDDLVLSHSAKREKLDDPAGRIDGLEEALDESNDTDEQAQAVPAFNMEGV